MNNPWRMKLTSLFLCGVLAAGPTYAAGPACVRETIPSGEQQGAAGEFNFLDPKTGKIRPAGGSLRELVVVPDCRFTVCGDTLYVLDPMDEEGESGKQIMYFDSKFHCSFAGTPDGLAIISPKEAGKDTWFLKNSEDEARPLAYTSCYHAVFQPVAGYDDGSLYVLAMNPTEPDVLYFRSVGLSG